MTEIKTYIQGQEIEPVEETRVYVHKDVLKYLELYQEIGTIPQLRALKEDRDKCFLEIQQYRAIGTVEELQKLKEKNNKDFELLLKAVKESYPMFKGAYVELDVFMGDVMRRFTRDRQKA